MITWIGNRIIRAAETFYGDTNVDGVDLFAFSLIGLLMVAAAISLAAITALILINAHPILKALTILILFTNYATWATWRSNNK